MVLVRGCLFVLLLLIPSILALEKGYSHINFINGNGVKYGFNINHDSNYNVGHQSTDHSKGFDEYYNYKVKKNPANESPSKGGFAGLAFSRAFTYNGRLPHSIHDRSYKFKNIIIPSAIEYGHMGYPPSKNSIVHPPVADLGYGSPAYGNSHMIGLGYYGSAKYKKQHQ